MYVCNCQGLKTSEVREAIAAADDHCPLGVHNLCGTKPRCGRCLVDMASLIKEYKSELSAPPQD